MVDCNSLGDTIKYFIERVNKYVYVETIKSFFTYPTKTTPEQAWNGSSAALKGS